LKDKYEPFEDFEDYLIEDILQRSFSDGSLEKQDYALDFDLDELYVFWRVDLDELYVFWRGKN